MKYENILYLYKNISLIGSFNPMGKRFAISLMDFLQHRQKNILSGMPLYLEVLLVRC